MLNLYKLLPLLLLCALNSCSSLGLKQTLTTELADAREARTALESQWRNIGENLTGLENRVNSFDVKPIDTGLFDYQLVQNAIIANWDAIIIAGGDPVEASMAASSSFTTALSNTNVEVRSTVEGVYSLAGEIFTQLKVELPKTVKETLVLASKEVANLEKSKAVGQTKLSTAKRNPLMTDVDMAQLKLDYASLVDESAKLTNLSNLALSQSGSYLDRITKSLTLFTSKVDMLGNMN